MRRSTSILAAAATVAAVAAGGLSAASPAQAAGGCTPMQGGSPLLAGVTNGVDTDNYSLVPGGDFSGSASGWNLSNASVSTGDQNPANVAGSTGPGVTRIGLSGSISSPSMCVKWQDHHIRFFYKAPRGTYFKVSTTGSSANGSSTNSVWIRSTSDTWQLSPVIAFPDWTDESGTELLKVTISNPLTWRGIQIDDVLVDPWRATRW